MTLSELCTLLSKDCSDVECSVVFSQFFHELKSIDIISVLPLSKSDLERVYKTHCKCRVMGVYEYICNDCNIPKDKELMDVFGNIYCNMHDNDYYNSLRGIFDEYVSVELYSKSLSASLPEFKKHGIVATEFNYAV